MTAFRPMVPAVFVALAWIAPATGGEFRELFDGKTLDGWVYEGNPGSDRHEDGRPVWSVKDGTIVCDGKGFGFLRYERETFKDFTFHVEFRMQPRCNTGIGFRTGAFDPTRSRASRPSFYSYEIQLVDDAGKPATPTSSGSLYRYVAPRVNAMKPAGEWNTLEVTAKGPHLKVVLNGDVLHDLDQTTVEALKEKPLEGSVCLQNHGGKVEFRGVRVREE